MHNLKCVSYHKNGKGVISASNQPYFSINIAKTFLSKVMINIVSNFQ